MKSVKVFLSAIAMLSGVITDAAAQSGKPIRFIVPVSPGGSLDIYARAFAPPMAKYLNQSIIIENVSGAGGNIGVVRVVKAAPDGDTLLFHNLGIATNAALYRKLDYNPVTDLEGVGVVTYSTMALAARPDLPVADMKQFIAYVRANGDKVTIGDGGVGGPANLCALLLMSATGAKLTTVSFKGAAPGMAALMGSQIDVMCDGTTSAARQIASGKLKGLAVTSKTRLQVMPDMPTIAESGLPGFELAPWSAIFAPKNTPRPIIQRLEAALHAALTDKELLAFFEKSGLVVPTPELASSAGLQTHVKSEVERWTGLFRKAGVPYID